MSLGVMLFVNTIVSFNFFLLGQLTSPLEAPLLTASQSPSNQVEGEQAQQVYPHLCIWHIPVCMLVQICLCRLRQMEML